MPGVNDARTAAAPGAILSGARRRRALVSALAGLGGPCREARLPPTPKRGWGPPRKRRPRLCLKRPRSPRRVRPRRPLLPRRKPRLHRLRWRAHRRPRPRARPRPPRRAQPRPNPARRPRPSTPSAPSPTHERPAGRHPAHPAAQRRRNRHRHDERANDLHSGTHSGHGHRQHRRRAAARRGPTECACRNDRRLGRLHEGT